MVESGGGDRLKTVIGLEVHAQPLTRFRMQYGRTARYADACR